MYRFRPAWTVGLETIAAIRVFSSPFVEGCDFHAAARRLIPAKQIVDENKFNLGPTLRERLPQPLVLGQSQRPSPAIAATMLTGGITEGIEHDKEHVTPFPGIVILQQPGMRMWYVVARIKRVRHGVGKQAFAHPI